MKIWTGYGSEHSMNLVLIGRFKQARDAEEAEGLIAKISEQTAADDYYLISHSAPENQRFSETMLELLRAEEIHTLSPVELEQFTYDYSSDREGNSITIRTDEADISAFIKVFLDRGARIEVYSGHHDSDEEAGNN